MGAISRRIEEKKAQLKIQFPDNNELQLLGKLIREIGVAGLRVVAARYYLRSCTQVGKMVSVNGRPLLRNKGKIYLADQVRIWSSISQAKILVGPGGVLRVGENSRINGCHLSVSHQVSIGRNVRISPDVLVIDNDFHDLVDHFADGKRQEIVIEDNVWLASRCIVLKGVRIGEGAVVAAGAVVTRDVPPFTVVGGVPARVIKMISPQPSPLLQADPY